MSLSSVAIRVLFVFVVLGGMTAFANNCRHSRAQMQKEQHSFCLRNFGPDSDLTRKAASFVDGDNVWMSLPFYKRMVFLWWWD